MFNPLIRSLVIMTGVFFALAAGAENDSGKIGKALAGLAGHWAGQLEYRDYRSDELIAIPCEMHFHAAPDNSYIIIEYTFTDPGHKIYASETIAIAESGIQTAYVSDGSIEFTRQHVSSFEQNHGAWKAIADSQGTDNGDEAAIRFTWHRKDNALTIEKQIKSKAMSDYSFRNRVVLTLTK